MCLCPIACIRGLQEDEVLRATIAALTAGKPSFTPNDVDWKEVAAATNRTTKQCRERWINVVDPTVLKSKWSPEEIETLFRAQAQHGAWHSCGLSPLPRATPLPFLLWTRSARLGGMARVHMERCGTRAVRLPGPPRVCP